MSGNGKLGMLKILSESQTGKRTVKGVNYYLYADSFCSQKVFLHFFAPKKTGVDVDQMIIF